MKHIKMFVNHLNLSLPLGPDIDTPGKVCKETIKDAEDWIKENKQVVSKYDIQAQADVTLSTYIVTVIVRYNLKTKNKVR